MLVFVTVIFRLTAQQAVSSSQRKFINSPCRIIVNFDNNIVTNDNQIVSLDSIKSEDLRKALRSTDERMVIEAVYNNRYLNGKLKPEFMHSHDGGWYMIESNNTDNAKKLITSL